MISTLTLITAIIGLAQPALRRADAPPTPISRRPPLLRRPVVPTRRRPREWTAPVGSSQSAANYRGDVLTSDGLLTVDEARCRLACRRQVGQARARRGCRLGRRHGLRPAAARARHAVRGHLDRGDLGYGPFSAELAGHYANWQERQHGWRPDVDRIRPFTSALHALEVALWKTTEPGDGVVVFTPIYYPFLDAIADSDRRRVDVALEDRTVGGSTPSGWRPRSMTERG